MSVNDALAKYEQRDSPDFSDEADALAAIANVATAINEEWATQQEAGVLVWTIENREKRLREWLEKLVEIVKKAATQFSAVSYAITVGFPLGVSVTISFPPPPSTAFTTGTTS